ncbi:uncharacterized protein LOC133302052 [Gastrolobium bilobum]|uniref:uncharacterized protein LOC133302052 n=1 Tax=Gastrolobium bilobum TaxID=150636 RepID=UPI002AB2202B|nr:uncharacterized protein LOC133302052 [Gastrolobium bilobum]
MGNNHGGFRLLGNGKSSYHLQLGRDVTIDLKKAETWEEGDGKKSKTWKASVRRVEGGGGLRINTRSEMEREGKKIYVKELLPNITKTVNAWGVITEQSAIGYGSESRRGLVVREWKKKGRDEKPFMITVAHYFTYINISTRTDIGLSVVVKIGVSSDNGGLDFDVEGPTQHPSSALFYMFDEVKRTKNWKPTSCPHCANTQTQCSGMLSERTEDSNNDPPVARTHHARAFLANEGTVIGDNNGNVNVNKLIICNAPPRQNSLGFEG